MKKIWSYVFIVILLLTLSPEVHAGEGTVDLSSLNIPALTKLKITTTYNNKSAIGLPRPNYEYSAHLLKLTDAPKYRILYGARWQTDTTDGDHIKYASSKDGITWTAREIPVIKQGKNEGNSFPPEYGNRMDPTIIRWNGKYYMYYQLQMKPGDKIGVAWSTDLINWTKLNKLVVQNDPPEDQVVHPKAIRVGDEVWLYFLWLKRGIYLIKSPSPVAFHIKPAVKVTGFNGMDGSQHVVLFPNDPSRTVHVVMGHMKRPRQPLLGFSRDGISWIIDTVSSPQIFPQQIQTVDNVFCNIASQPNSGLDPSAGNPNLIDSVYSCATFDGASRGDQPGNVWDSDLSIGKITFEDISSLEPPLPGDLNQDGKVNIFDYNVLVSKFGNPYTIFDYNILVANYGK